MWKKNKSRPGKIFGSKKPHNLQYLIGITAYFTGMIVQGSVGSQTTGEDSELNWWSIQRALSDSIEKSNNSYVFGANVGDDCDFSLYEKFIIPLYNAKTAKDFQTNLTILYHAAVAQTLVEKSCFGFDWDRQTVTYMECDSAQLKCQCYTQEPFKSINSSSGGCELEKSHPGSPCDPERAALVYKWLNTEAIWDDLNKATDPTGIVNARWRLQGSFYNYRRYRSLEADKRLVCLNFDGISLNAENLHCTVDGTCDCISLAPRLNYVNNNGHCEAEPGAICNLIYGETLMSSSLSSNEFTDLEISDAHCPHSCYPWRLHDLPDHITATLCADDGAPFEHQPWPPGAGAYKNQDPTPVVVIVLSVMCVIQL